MFLVRTFFKQNSWLIAITAICLILQVTAALLIPKYIGALIDQGILQRNMNAIAEIGTKMFITGFLGSIIGLLSSYLSASIAARFGFETRDKIIEKLQLFSLSDIENKTVSGILTRVIDDIENIQQTIMLTLQLVVPAPFMVIVTIVLTYQISPSLTLIPLIVIMIYVVVAYLTLKKAIPLSKLIQPLMERMMIVTREFYTGMNMIRAFNNVNYEEDRNNQQFTNYADGMIKTNKIFAILTPMAFLLMGLSFAGILWIGGNLVGDGDLQVGMIAAIIEFSILALLYLMVGTMVFVSIPKTISSLYRVEEILNSEIEITDPINVQKDVIDDSDPLVSFNDVTFSYPDSEKPVLENISFEIRQGDTVAIVGGTGSGKSTIAKVLLRFNDISKGSIFVRNNDIRNITQNELRENISYTPQKAFLFKGSLKSNLLMGNSNATTEELNNALAISQMSDFVRSLPSGLESLVSQGGFNFSGGQRQRLCIARSLVKKADVYVFDDSFSALDYKTDVLLRSALKKKMGTKTMLIIAQRLSTIQDADKIIVLDKGRIVGQGKHSELIKSNKVYQDFAESQGLINQQGG
ncbi:ABC transporter ATP-binding protein [Enterococcus faecalis]|uniref:ABC transporter ATP-binding protein n=1 Tax=Enterococcus TaxID=1350 RepID=UPI001A978930|nr:ABC transporter ATP-binding protein [Enterococcus faecalis]MBO1126608.1 ABC transporter ATP-binding protein [Enterococcus faecalis]